jgi:hypothetical protein
VDRGISVMPKSEMKSHDTVPVTPEIFILLALLLWGRFYWAARL